MAKLLLHVCRPNSDSATGLEVSMPIPRAKPISGFLFGFFVAWLAIGVTHAGGDKALINADGETRVAIRGYDTVAYFTESKPTKGSSDFSHSWRDVEWHFASAEHRDLFVSDPERYAPQYGGFCAMAMTQGTIKVIDPEAWTIVEGKLYLNFSMKGREFFREDLGGNIEKSNDHWARIKQEN